METEYVMTDIQLKIARAIAANFGHWWATCDGVYDGYTIGEIDAVASAKGEDRPIQGINSPCAVRMETGGTAVCHTTATGRLTWYVYADGLVTVHVTRPTSVRDKLDGWINPNNKTGYLRASGVIRLRHWQAIYGVAKALQVPNENIICSDGHTYGEMVDYPTIQSYCSWVAGEMEKGHE